MPSYRFCRPDDLALLVAAINAAYLMHYPDEPVMTIERFKEHMTLFDVRPGNCMVALERQVPVGVVVSTKRASGSWIQAVGCQPEFQRRGIAAQLIEALVRKIAIQKVPVITAEVPEANSPACKLFEALAFTRRGRYVSYHGPLPTTSGTTDTVTERPAAELLTLYPIYHTSVACWERQVASLAAYGTLAQGYAYWAHGTVQGYLLHRGQTILDLALAPEADADRVSQALLSRMGMTGLSHATLAKVPDDDPLNAVLPRLGFAPTCAYLWLGQELH